MAEKIKFKTGTLTSMPSDLEAGTIAVARDTGDMYICVPDLENPTSNKKYKHHINPQTNYNQTDTTKLDYLVGREKLFDKTNPIIDYLQIGSMHFNPDSTGLTVGVACSAQSNSVAAGTGCFALGDSTFAVGHECSTSTPYSLAVGDKAFINEEGVLFAVGTGRADSGDPANNGFYVKYDGHECSAYVQKEDSSGNVVIKELSGDIEWDNF